MKGGEEKGRRKGGRIMKERRREGGRRRQGNRKRERGMREEMEVERVK